MITITSFYPFRNFLRVTHEFYEDKVVVKMKSLTYEREYEVYYEELDEISDKYHIDEDQVSSGIGFLSLITFALILFFNTIYAYPALLKAVQILFVCSLIIFITGFKKSWQINFSDKKGNILTSIKQTAKNIEQVSQAIELIKSKRNDIREVTAAEPFAEEEPVFELIVYDMFKFGKSIERFYEYKLIAFYKTLFKEVAYSTKYSQFSGKVYRGKVSTIPWFLYFCNLLIVGFILLGLDLAFDMGIGVNFLLFLRVLSILFIICWLLSFLKREAIGLYDYDENIAYGTYINQKNKELTEEIIEFIRSKIPLKENSKNSREYP